MTYREAVAWLYSLEPRGVRLELDRIRTVLARRGDPQRGLTCVHVAGTNGKGSVAAMIAAALEAAGRKVGLYTSPHLHRFVERVRIGGRAIAEREVARRVAELRSALGDPGMPELTFFETTTVMAFEAFREAACEVVVLEVGLGGRLDATNVVTPVVSVITGIARDHEAMLGPTVAEIAREKAGVLKAGVPAVVAVRDEVARQVIATELERAGTRAWWIDRDYRVAGDGRTFAIELPGARIDGIRVRLGGAHQRDNAATAAAALVVLRGRRPEIAADDDAIRRGLAKVKWPARLELLRGRPPLLIDAAHNPEGCRALAAHLHALPRGGRRVLVFGAMRDKAHAEMLASLVPEVDAVVYAAPPMARAAPPETLAAIHPGEVEPTASGALARAEQLAGTGGLVVAAGSIFLIAELRARRLGLRSDPPIGM